MSLFDYLMESRTKHELAKELAATVKENVALQDRVGALETELFWIKVAERDNTPHQASARHACIEWCGDVKCEEACINYALPPAPGLDDSEAFAVS